MNLTDAAKFQDSIDAVMAGTADERQCAEAVALYYGLLGVIRDARDRALALVGARDQVAAVLGPDDGRVTAILAKGTEPRIVVGALTGKVGTPEEIAMLEAARQAEIDADTGAPVLAEKG